MIVLSLYDETQRIICGKLAYTEYMLTEVLKKINGCSCRAEITTLEDLGFSNNIVRMRGGFYTGTNIRWESEVPFVPVDATLNSCGVSVFRLKENIDYKTFQEKIKYIDEKMKMIGMVNNLNRGNHFIALCEDLTGKQYLVIHGSDNKYKYGINGLYPRSDTWYYDEICVEKFPHGYIRYITGDTAERFYKLYLESEKANPIRNKAVAESVFGDCTEIEEIVYSPHYGMPDKNSISIGSQWRQNLSVLLSYEGSPIYIIKNGEQQTQYLPHGFGLTLKGKCKSLKFSNDGIVINDIEFECEDGLMSCGITKTRNSSIEISCKAIREFMPSRRIDIISELYQVCSYTRNGIKVFK